jgi:uncharacterized MnhB-related membrane protein
MLIWHGLVVAGIVVCAILAIRAQRLLTSALWLAGCSALVAVLLYLMGAAELAVIELSVGAGLVTVLFVFAINIAGEDATSLPSPLPRPLSWGVVLVAIGLLAWRVLPELLPLPWLRVTDSGTFSDWVWGNRMVDLLLQVVLIFAGVLGMMGLLSEHKKAGEHEEKSA